GLEIEPERLVRRQRVGKGDLVIAVMQIVPGDEVVLALQLAAQIYLMLDQELELEAEDDAARIRVAADATALARLMERIEVVSGIARRVDVNLLKAKALV